MQIYEEYGEWYYGRKKIKGTIGIFPKSYIHVLNNQTNIDTLIHEITNVLREWGHHWKHLYVVCIKYMIILYKKLNNVKFTYTVIIIFLFVTDTFGTFYTNATTNIGINKI